MKVFPEFFELDKFGITVADVARMRFRCDPTAIHPDVILMPVWPPTIFEQWTDPVVTITSNLLYETVFEGKPVSIVQSGIGAAQAGEIVLALGCTACERIVFAGSAGGLRSEMRIGDLLLPAYSISGDGFCRYLEPGFPPPDCMLERQSPDEVLARALAQAVERRAREAGVTVHYGPVFCSDTILGQFRILDQITGELGCIGIEMETAAVFKAARSVGIRASAVFSISDVSVLKKTVYAGPTEEEKVYRKGIRRQVLARAMLEGLLTEAS